MAELEDGRRRTTTNFTYNIPKHTDWTTFHEVNIYLA